MDAQQFLAEFGHIANAPGGIGRLRELIYQLAIQGRLVPPSQDSDAVKELLQQSKIVRQALIEGKQYKRIAALESAPVEIPADFDIPENWRWSRLLDIGEINPRNTAPDEAIAAFLPMKGISEQHGKAVSVDQKPWQEIQNGYSHFMLGDVVLAKITPCFENGKAAVISQLPDSICFGAGTTEIHVFRPIHQGIIPGYIYAFLRSPYFVIRGKLSMTGTAGQKRLPTEYFATRALPLPSTDEQRRVVSKVDELIGLCDQLEVQQEKRESQRTALRTSILDALATASSPHDIGNAWERVSEQLGHVIDSPNDINEFIKVLQTLAVRGLFTPATKDEPAVEEIRSACDRLRDSHIKSGLMRRQKPIVPAETEESYPSHWAVVPFDDVAVVMGGVTKGRNLRGRQSINCPYLSVANVQRGYLSLNDLKRIDIPESELEKYLVRSGDILIAEGGDWDKVGRTAVWTGNVENCLHQNHVFKARVSSRNLLNRWVELVFNSGIGRKYFSVASKQTTNLASINMTQLRSFPLPVPPVSEQVAILNKLEALVGLCEKLHRQVARRTQVGSLLAQASVAALTGVGFKPDQEERLKPPHTELIAPLHLGTPPKVRARAPLATILAQNGGSLPAREVARRFAREDIGEFYTQLKLEVQHGWIQEPAPAVLKIKGTA